MSFTQLFLTKFTTIRGQNCGALPWSQIHSATFGDKTDYKPHPCKTKTYGGMRVALCKKATDQCSSFMKFYQFSKNKCFSICCLLLVYFQNPEIIFLVIWPSFAKRLSPTSLYHLSWKFLLDLNRYASLVLTDLHLRSCSLRTLQTMEHDPEHDSKFYCFWGHQNIIFL